MARSRGVVSPTRNVRVCGRLQPVIRKAEYSYGLVVSRIVGFALVALLLSGCSLSAASGPPWVEMHPRIHPSRHVDGFAAYDAATRQVVLYGGAATSVGSMETEIWPTQTWTWNGRDWTELHPTVHPPRQVKGESAMAYDARTKNVVLVVPAIPLNPLHRDSVILQHVQSRKAATAFLERLYPKTQTWTWNGTRWTELHPSANPRVSLGASMAYDAATGDVVLVGLTAHGLETWTWNGVTWTQQHPTKSPSGRTMFAMAYDPQVREVLLFGGVRGNFYWDIPVPGDTWAWNGTNWTELHPSVSPPARYVASMAYDPQIRALVLFGGTSGTSETEFFLGPQQVFGDTWAWKGANWIRLHPSVSPPPRSGASMAYDAATKSLVLFGGDGPYHSLPDTWTLRFATDSPRHVGRRSRASGRATTIRP